MKDVDWMRAGRPSPNFEVDARITGRVRKTCFSATGSPARVVDDGATEAAVTATASDGVLGRRGRLGGQTSCRRSATRTGTRKRDRDRAKLPSG